MASQLAHDTVERLTVAHSTVARKRKLVPNVRYVCDFAFSQGHQSHKRRPYYTKQPYQPYSCLCENVPSFSGKAVTWGPLEGITTDYAAVEAPSPTARIALRGTGARSDRLPLAWHALNVSVAMPNGMLCFSSSFFLLHGIDCKPTAYLVCL